jgi:hypothetical protein
LLLAPLLLLNVHLQQSLTFVCNKRERASEGIAPRVADESFAQSEFVELLARHTCAMCRSGTALSNAVSASLSSNVLALKRCGLADR